MSRAMRPICPPAPPVSTDKTNPVLVIGDHRLPINKDILVKGDRTFHLEGVVVQATETEPDKFYIPDEAVRCIRDAICPG